MSAREEAFLSRQRVGRLATAGADNQPHVVPVCYVYHQDAIYSPLDEKPKSVGYRELRRVRNILENGNAAVVVDHYSEEWSDLGYVLARGRADLLEPAEKGHESAIGALRTKYPQYRAMALELRPLIRVTPERVTSWGNLEVRPVEMDMLTLMRGRRSVRWYLDEPLDPDAVRSILEAGRWAPSPHGRQPWRFAVLTRPERKMRLADEMAAMWRMQLELDGQPEEVVAVRLRKARERLVGAPLVVVLCLYLDELDQYPDPARQEAETTMAVQSLGAAAQNMLLTAYGIGLDGGWMCAPLFCPETVCAALGLSDRLIPHAMLTFGKAARPPVRRARRPLEGLIELYD